MAICSKTTTIETVGGDVSKVFALLEYIGVGMVAVGVGMWVYPGAGVAAGGVGLLGLTGVAEYMRARPGDV